MANSSVFYRSASPYPVAVRGAGSYLWDESGKRYLDAASGALVCNLGHGLTRIAEAMAAQARTLQYVHGSQFSSAIYERYAERLSQLAGGGYRFWACSGGSEAVESAIKLARQWQVERGESGRFKVIARMPSYHGASLGALASSGMGSRRALYTPLLREEAFPKIPAPDPALPGLQDAAQLEAEVERQGEDRVAAFLAETVVGAADPALAPAEGYFQEIEAICRRHGLLYIADEVMCGMGRCGQPMAFSRYGVRPDVVVLGKGLAAGYAPLAGILVKEEIFAELMAGSGRFTHGYTYSGHPVSLAAGEAVLDILWEEELFGRAGVLGARLEQGLRQIGDPRVLKLRREGLMLGLVLGDPESAGPFPRPGLAARVGRAAMERGLIVYPGSGAADGTRGDHLLLGPPFNATEGEIDLICELLQSSLAATA